MWRDWLKYVLFLFALVLILETKAQPPTAEYKPAARLIDGAPVMSLDTSQAKIFAPFLKQFATDTSEQVMVMLYFPKRMERTYVHHWEKEGRCWTSWYKDSFTESKAQQCGGDLVEELDSLLHAAPGGSFTIESRAPALNDGMFFLSHQKGGRILLNVYYASHDATGLVGEEKKFLSDILALSEFMKRHKP